MSSTPVAPKAVPASLFEATPIKDSIALAKQQHASPRWCDTRLKTAVEYDRVFSHSERARVDAYLILASPNAHGHARLGLIVGKRQLKRAVDRNRVKRCARAAFQAVRGELPACDFVVRLLTRPEAGKEGAGLARALQRAGQRAREKWPTSFPSD